MRPVLNPQQIKRPVHSTRFHNISAKTDQPARAFSKDHSTGQLMPMPLVQYSREVKQPGHSRISIAMNIKNQATTEQELHSLE